MGGIENTTLHLATAWTSLGHTVTLVTEQPAEPDYDVQFSFVIVRRPGKLDWKQVLANSDIVISNGQSLRPLLHWLRAGVPFGYIHAMAGRGGLQHGLGVAVRGWVGCIANRLASFNVCVSRFVAKSVCVHNPIVIYNFAAPIFRPMSAPASGRFLYYGRIIQEKGVDTLIEAVGICKKNGHRIEVDIVGDGNWKYLAVAMAQRLGIADRVAFKPSQYGEELVGTINAARAVVVPSHCNEGFGMVVIEAMACGKCVIVARDGGVPEVADGYALTFQPGDAGALANCLADTAADDRLIAAYGQLGLARARDLTLEKAAERYIILFREVLARARGPARRKGACGHLL